MKRPEVSVITAVKEINPEYLIDAYESLNEQQVSWEWLLQADGTEVDIPPNIIRDRRVILQINNETYGAGITRNLALSRSNAPIIQNLDADDYLFPNALDVMYEQIRTNSYAFVFGKDVSLDLDGNTYDYAGGLSPGVILPGIIYKRWQEIHMTPVHPAGIMWRKDILFKYGGWHGLSSGEDTAVMLAASVKHPVYFLDEKTLVYRLHDKQLTSHESYKDTKEANWAFIEQRIGALLCDIELTI
jgi:glycosyltransferase involved in cell wall biosynthesis